MGDTISKRLIERLRGDEGVEPRITRQMVHTQLERAGALRVKLQAYLQAGVDDKKRSIALHLQSSRAESTAAALRAQADLIYNRYYTQGGICDMLLRFEDYVYEEMEDLSEAAGALAINKISEEELLSAPTLDQVLPQILDFLGEKSLFLKEFALYLLDRRN